MRELSDRIPGFRRPHHQLTRDSPTSGTGIVRVGGTIAFRNAL